MRALSLCSGVGMLDLAAERSGMQIVGQVEIDPWCSSVLAYHWPHIKRMNDMKEVCGDEFGTIDIVFGGIPCQPFSSAGMQQGIEDHRYLWPETNRIITATRPRWIVLENVASFLPMVFDTVSTDLEVQGYEVGAALLPACALDASHIRERAVIIASSVANANSTRMQARKFHKWDESTFPLADDAGKSMANTTGQRCEWDAQAGWEARCGVEHTSDVGHSDRARCQEYEHATNSSAAGRSDRRYHANRTAGLPQSGLGRAIDGAARGLDGRADPAFQGQPQADWEAPRTIARRKSKHAHRLKALGNGIYVPLWEEIFRSIVQIEMGMK